MLWPFGVAPLCLSLASNPRCERCLESGPVGKKRAERIGRTVTFERGAGLAKASAKTANLVVLTLVHAR